MTGSVRRRVTTAAACGTIPFALLTAGCTSPQADPAAPDPEATPSRIALTPTAHPRTSLAFAWRTDRATKRGFVQVRRAGGGKKRRVRESRDRTVTFAGWDYTSRHHAAVVRSLRPDTRYRYRVGAPGAWSTWRTFRTAHGPYRRWRFAYFGDAQIELDTTWRRSVDRAFDGRSIDLTLHAGDLVDQPTDDAQWSAWFRGLRPHRRTTPVLPAVGNHALRGDKRLRQFRSHFRLPENGPTATTYAVDYQGVRFIALDTNHPSDRAQRRFLRYQLEHAGRRWTVVLFHKPIFASTRDRDSSPQRSAWLRTLERHGADLVLQGHDHVYARGYVRRRADAAAGRHKRPMYVVSNAGGKYYALDGGHDWRRHGARRVEAVENVSTYQIVRVTRSTLTYRSVVTATGRGADADVGDVVDRFRLER